MRSKPDTERLEQIRSETASILRESIGDVEDVVLLDVPNQRNVGDTLIWLGELSYLRRLGYRIRHTSDLLGYNPDAVRRCLPSDGVVLLHGGGNFGDLWLGHQELREKVVRDLPSYRIVQLPQSVYFRDPARAKQANAAMENHPDLTVLLRDSESMHRAAEQLPGVRSVFCADMAFGFEPPHFERHNTAQDEVLVIARADRESASGLGQVTPDWTAPHRLRITDWWKDEAQPLPWRLARAITRAQAFSLRARRALGKRLGFRFPMPQVPGFCVRWALKAINQGNLNHALTLYTPAKALVVDRLHAHVLAILLGIDHVLLDNNYRKLGAVYDDYSSRFETAHYSVDLDDTKRQITEIMGS